MSRYKTAGGTAVAAPVSTALQAQVQSAEAANVEALLGSLGLGGNVNATA